jgi:hypothetical protein
MQAAALRQATPKLSEALVAAISPPAQLLQTPIPAAAAAAVGSQHEVPAADVQRDVLDSGNKRPLDHSSPAPEPAGQRHNQSHSWL